jgi:hypothetical protein
LLPIASINSGLLKGSDREAREARYVPAYFAWFDISNSKHRILVTPAKRGKGKQQRAKQERPTWLEKTLEERHRTMTWMQRLKRVLMGRPPASTLKSVSVAAERSKLLPRSEGGPVGPQHRRPSRNRAYT